MTFISRQVAIKNIRELMSTQVEITKKVNSGNGHVPRRLITREARIISTIFRDLTGGAIVGCELEEILGD